MGEVFLATDTKLNRKVALKLLPPHIASDPESKARFEHEARAAAGFRHANIVTVHELAEHDGQLVIVMEYVEGPTLAEYCKQEDPSIDRILDLTTQIAQGLQKAHEAGVVHRDLKHSNILVDSDGQARILDFGLAKLKGATRITKSGSTVGTAAYMSPEQAQGQEVDHRTDIWSFGVILYEMVTKRLPFEAEHEAALIYAVANEVPEPLARYKAGVPAELQRIVTKCLAKNAGERYQSAADLVADLQTLRRTTAGHGIPIPSQRSRSRSAVIGLAAIVVIIAAVWGAMQSKHWLRPAAAEAKSLAVVDFDNIGAQEDVYLASGLAEGLAIKLRQLEGVRVASSADIRRLAKQQLLPREVAARLDVQYAVGGSLLREDTLVRVNVELIEKSTGDVVWSDHIDRQFTEIFEFLDDVSLRIAQALEVRLTPGEEAALATTPTDDAEAYDHYLRGRHYYHNVTFRDNELAEREFERALQIDPDYPLALAGLADAYVQRYKERFDYDEYWLDSSDALIERASELAPDLAEAYEARAEVLLEKDNLLGALDAARRARDLQPAWDEPYVRLGEIYQQRGELSKALELYEQAIALRPSVSAWCGKGNIFRTRLRHDSAEAAYRAAIELNPQHDRPYYELGWTYGRYLGKAEEAEQMFRQAIDVRPDRADSYRTLVWGKGPEVEELVRGFIEKYPYNWEAYDALYNLLAWMTGDWPAALEVMEQAIDKNPDRVWPYLVSARSRSLGMGKTVDIDRAVEEIERALELRPNSSRVLEAAGDIYASLDKPEIASDYYRRALSVNPGSAGILCSMAKLMLHYHKYDSAVIVALKAIEQKPGLTEFTGWIGTSHKSYVILRDAMTHLHRSDEYLGIIKNATEHYGQDDPEFFLYLADEQRQSGQFEDAIVTYQRYLDIQRAPGPLMGLGMAQWLSGDPETALQTFYEVAAISPRYYARLISLLKYTGRLDEIEQYLDTLHVEEVPLWLQPAPDYYRSMRRFDDALAVYDEALKSKEEISWEEWEIVGVASLYRQMGKLAKARELLEDDESSSLSAIVGATVERAKLAAIEGDLNTAMNLAREAFENSPADNFHDVRVGFCATMQYATGQTGEALNTLEKVKGRLVRALLPGLYLRAQIETVSGSPDAEYYLEQVQLLATRGARYVHPFEDLGMYRCLSALASARLGDSKKARDDIEYARRLEPERADIAYYSACTYSLSGDIALALQWLETAVERGHQELWWARVDPDLDALREIPRFREIMSDWDDRIQALLQ